LSTAVPIRFQDIRPTDHRDGGAEAAAQLGYSELTFLLCRRRLLRRIYVVLGSLQGTVDAITALEGRVGSCMERLNSLGLRPTRLRDRALAEAARHFGWPVEVGAR